METYVGEELDLFEKALIWKQYFARFISPFLGEENLEVGAGLAGSTSILCKPTFKTWLCLEPDSALAAEIQNKIDNKKLSPNCQVKIGQINSLPTSQKFDSILYIDVLEHIEKDQEELELAAQYLKPNGRIIVLSPAHPFLFSPFDKAIGHYRRYNKKMIRALAPKGLQLKKMQYLDSLGLMASLANKYLLKQQYPNEKQIQFWQKFILPVSKIIDPLTSYKLGKTIIAIWEKS